VTLPGQLAEQLAGLGNIKVLRLPFQLPSYVIMQHCHERYTTIRPSAGSEVVMVELFSDQKAFKSPGVRGRLVHPSIETQQFFGQDQDAD